MNYSKGMSQTLTLIVAASVLMMTALTVIMLVQGSLGSFGSSTTSTSCIRAAQTQCTGTMAQSINMPGTCLTDGKLIRDIPSDWETPDEGDVGPNTKIDCSTVD